MNDKTLQSVMATWVGRGPARLDIPATAQLLGFAEPEIQILVRTGKLTPLGEPKPNGPKWFAKVEIVPLAADRDWLHRATLDVTNYLRFKRDRQLDRRAVSSPAPGQVPQPQ